MKRDSKTNNKNNSNKDNKTFYIVWSRDGPNNPQVRTSDLRQAQTAAKNMALRYPSQKFYVMQSVYQYSVDHAPVLEKAW